MKKKKVLILHGKPGMGHLMTAQALLEVFGKKYPEIEVKDIDAFDFLRGPAKYGYPYFYNYAVSKAPFIFRFLYDIYDNKGIQKILTLATLPFIRKAHFIFFVKDFSPDFILATNPLPLQIVSLVKEAGITNILSGNVCTDFGFHAIWYSSDINYYFVATKAIKQSLLDHGVNSDKIRITGIPVKHTFNQFSDRDKILKSLNFNSQHPVLLIVGGQLKYKNLLKIISGIRRKNNLIQFIVITGRDKNLQREIENSKLKKNNTLKIFGLVRDMEKFMTVADLILSKAGGSITAESLAKGLPMVVYKTIPGQEEDNVNYLVDNNAGIKAKSIKEIIATVTDLFSKPNKLKEMKDNCLKIQKPNAAVDIADFVVSKI